MESIPPQQASLFVEALHYSYPALCLAYFIFSSTVAVCTTPANKTGKNGQLVKRDVLFPLMALVTGSYAINSINILIRTLVNRPWAAEQHETVYLVSSFLIWLILAFAYLDMNISALYPYCGASLIAAGSETTLFILSNIFIRNYGLFDLISLSVQGLRICALVVMLCVYITLRHRSGSDIGDEERQPLLPEDPAPITTINGKTNGNGASYGATESTSAAADDNTKNDSSSSDSDDDDDVYSKRHKKAMERVQKRLENDGNWWTYVQGFSLFIPHVWPVHDKVMQLRAVAVGCCLLTGNFLNVMIPRQLGMVTDALVKGDSPWVAAAVYAALTFANSGSCIGWVQFWLWRPLEQYAEQSLSTASHTHIMSLSSDFHERKDSADIHRAVNQGISVTKLVEMLIFEVMPMMIDLIAVCIYLNYLFGPYMGLILAVTSLVFVYCTTKLVSLATNKRRLYLKSFRKEWISVYTSIENWRTASYFNNIPYEENRYSSNVESRLRREKDYRLMIFFVGAVQIFALTLGLIGACFLAIYQVTRSVRSPGDFVILLSYWAQLKGPLTFFSNAYKRISESLMDAEHLLELFQTKATVVDCKDARPLVFKKGEVVFDNVNFHYEARKETLKDIDFSVPGGSTIALVGETGSGKSTILKLLDRFYDVTDGSIKIDGQDIREVTLTSLRDKIGVVPQDPDLFNESIINNIRYAKLGASAEEVYEACKAAAIHEKILSFPDGYQSKVGSHGVKLSGGERQRIAIARAILKRPDIIVLDEATSSVDSATEQLIQDAFRELCKGRTTFIVAHRLSTIMRADRILVIKDGEIIENGSHDELIQAKGTYNDLWAKQLLVKPGEEVTSSGSSNEPATVNVSEQQTDTACNTTALSTTDNFQQDCSKAPTNGTKERKTRLNADTPAFVPIHLRVTAAPNDCLKQDQHHNSEAKGNKSCENIQKTQTNTNPKSSANGIHVTAEMYASSEGPGKVSKGDYSEPSRSGQDITPRKLINGDSIESGVGVKGRRTAAKSPTSRHERQNHLKGDRDHENDSLEGTQESGEELTSTEPSTCDCSE